MNQNINITVVVEHRNTEADKTGWKSLMQIILEGAYDYRCRTIEREVAAGNPHFRLGMKDEDFAAAWKATEKDRARKERQEKGFWRYYFGN